MTNVIFLRSNQVVPEPRVEKEAKALFFNGYNVTILECDRTGSLPEKEIKEFSLIQHILIFALFGEVLRNIFNLLGWNFCLFYYLFRYRENNQFIHACDFDTIIPALIIKFLFKKKIIYDIFDFYANSHSNVPKFLCKFIIKIDTWAIGKVDAAVLTDESSKLQVSGAYLKRLEYICKSPEKISYNIAFYNNYEL